MNFVRLNERKVMRRAVPLGCLAIRESDGRVIAERALDISSDGMLLSTPAIVDQDEHLLITFRATELGLLFVTEAEVARVVAGRRHGDRGPAIGVRFTSLDPIQRFILRGAFRKVPPPLPKRKPRLDYASTARVIAA